MKRRKDPKRKTYLVTVSGTDDSGRTHTARRTVRSRERVEATDHADLFTALDRRVPDVMNPNIVVMVQKPRKYKPRPMSRVAPSDDDYERRAVDYAKWLMQRDGISIPETRRAVCVWDHVYSNTRIGRDGNAIRERRIRAVQFSNGFEFTLPNWDFNPDHPVEEIGNWDEIEAHLLAHDRKILRRRKARESKARRKKMRGLYAAMYA